MFLWVFFLGGGPEAASTTHFTGILHPIVDTEGTFSTNTDPDGNDETTELSTSLNPT